MRTPCPLSDQIKPQFAANQGGRVLNGFGVSVLPADEFQPRPLKRLVSRRRSQPFRTGGGAASGCWRGF
jgi:hypothetical protein